MLELTRRIRSWTFAPLLAVALLARHAPAQCAPDGLSPGPCCVPAGVNLPAFPPLSQGTSFICFDGCTAALNAPFCTDIGVPQPVLTGGALACGAYTIRFRVMNCGTTTIVWNGLVNAYYSRNFQVFTPPPGGSTLTVWRFVINGDFLPTPALPVSPLLRPACTAMFPRVYFSGYIDYALDCNTGTWAVAWSLSHECDGIHHQLGTARPAPATGLHPTRSFTWVGPDAGFVVASATLPTSNGPIIQQSFRRINWNTAGAPICSFEEPATGSFTAANAFCLCTTTGATQYVASLVSATGTCGTSVSPAAAFGFYQKRIGTWTNQNVFPGRQILLFDFGDLIYVNGCTGATSLEWFEGIETLKGYPAVDFSGVTLGIQFEDLASSNVSSTNSATWIGAPHVAYYLLKFNMP